MQQPQPRPTAAQLNQLSKECHAAARAKGFYDAPALCPVKKRNKYLQRQMLLITGEVFEAYEALRTGAVNSKVAYDGEVSYTDYYKKHVKGTAAEEFADTVIRIFDCSGALNHQYENDIPQSIYEFYDGSLLQTVDDFFTAIASLLIHTLQEDIASYEHFDKVLCLLYALADKLGIDMAKAIADKFRYNATREYKHGKLY